MEQSANPLIAHLDRTLPVDGFDVGNVRTSIVESLGRHRRDFMSIVTVESHTNNDNPNEGIFGTPVDSLDVRTHPQGYSSGGRVTTLGGAIIDRFPAEPV